MKTLFFFTLLGPECLGQQQGPMGGMGALLSHASMGSFPALPVLAVWPGDPHCHFTALHDGCSISGSGDSQGRVKTVPAPLNST